MELVESNDGTQISIATSGSGPPLVLIHGTTADHTRWGPISPQLEGLFTLYAVDRRGRGESGDAPNYHILAEAHDIAAVVDSIGEPAFVLGHSYGAVCGLEAALLTDGIEKMILYEPPLPTDLPLYTPGLPERLEDLLGRGENESALEAFYREVVRMPEHELAEYRQLPVWSRRIGLAPTIPREMAIDREYSFEPSKFVDLDIPTLLLLGGDSPPLFQKAVEMAHAALPTSKLVTLPGQQHIAMDTSPELFISEVVRFLRE